MRVHLTSPTKALVRREVRSALQRWRTLVLIICWLAVALFATYSLWPDDFRDPRMLRARSQELVMALTVVLLLALAMTVPALAAVSISAERDEDTFDMLRLTLLSNRGFIAGKILSSLLLSLLFLIAVLPVLSVVQFLVGLDNTQILQLIAFLLLFTLMCASMGVACSTFFNRTIAAIAAAYALLLLIVFAPLISSAYLPVLGGWSGSFPVSRRGISTLDVLESIITRGLPWSWFAAGCVLPALICVISALLARLFLVRKREPRYERESKLIDDQTVLQERRKHFPYYLIDPLRRKPPISDKRNPMVIREIRWGLFNRASWIVRAFYVTFIIIVFPVLGACMSPNDNEVTFAICIQIVLVIFAAPILTGNAWTRERQMGNIDMIRMTMLRPIDLLVGKAVGGIAAMFPVVLAVFAASIPAYIFHYHSIAKLLAGHLTLLHCALVSLALCLFASFYARRTTAAIATGGLLCVGVYLAGFGIASIISVDGYALESERYSPLFAYHKWVTMTGYLADSPSFVEARHIWQWSLVYFTVIGATAFLGALALLNFREMRDK